MEEIKAGDIMLNNWVLHNGEPRQISGLHGDFVSLFCKGCDKAQFETLTKNINPIPLTEDILLKAGFGKRDNKCFLIIPTGVALHSIYFEVEFEYERMIFIMWVGKDTENTKKVFLNIQSLHELQNLFKSLTGNDLKIEL